MWQVNWACKAYNFYQSLSNFGPSYIERRTHIPAGSCLHYIHTKIRTAESETLRSSCLYVASVGYYILTLMNASFVWCCPFVRSIHPALAAVISYDYERIGRKHNQMQLKWQQHESSARMKHKYTLYAKFSIVHCPLHQQRCQPSTITNIQFRAELTWERNIWHGQTNITVLLTITDR